ncbi:MAG: NADH-quinone oxidoreductase subunit NuoG [Desulfobacteraceae bacterium]|jgi:NADH-quinone oxidoreductase subunit G
MPKLTIDDRSIEVPKGTKVISAAEQLGIMIPRFCYHPALGAVGACRVCAVKFEDGPVKGIRMSCMVDVVDGMIVSTMDPEVVDFRRHVIEWLMLNHPHDCPVCDEGGHCLLQDLTISGGHGVRRYQGVKRTHQDQYLGPLVAHEMNRCIQCYRCVRFYREYCGYTDFGVMGSAAKVYFGRYKEGTLESPFAGNLIDICPTGVFTDRPSRYLGRRWDFQRTPSICPHCALGCNITVSVRYREIVRREARFNSFVNGHFICDRGRYGYAIANAENRPRIGRVQREPVDRKTALTQMITELDGIVEKYGSKSVAVIGSCRSSLETLAAMQHLCQIKNYLPPVLFTDKYREETIKRAALKFSTNTTVNVQDLAGADLILVVGADPLNEAPISALALRKAQLNGALIVVMDPRPIELPCDFHHLWVTPESLAVRLAGLIQAGLKQELIDQIPMAAELIAVLESIDIKFYESNGQLDAIVVTALKNSTRPVILCGTHICDPLTIDLITDAVQLLRKSGKGAGQLFLFPDANALGAGLIPTELTNPEDLIEKIENDQVKAVIAVESDPLLEFNQRNRLVKALEQVELLVGIDYIDGSFAKMAHLFLPVSTLDECGGTFINTHGLAQTAPIAFAGGTPISQTGKGRHPPRTFTSLVPGGDLPSSAKVLLHLSGEDDMDLKELMARMHPAFAPLAQAAGLPGLGLRLSIEPLPLPGLAGTLSEDLPSLIKEKKEDFILLLIPWGIGTEYCSSQSPVLMQRAESPYLAMHPTDARNIGLTETKQVVITTESGKLSVATRLTEKVAPGVLVLPCHRALDWQVLDRRQIRLFREQIKAQES